MGEKRVKLSKVRKFIGDRLRESVVTIPQVWGIVKVDVTDLLELQQSLREEGRKVALTSVLAKAIGVAMKDFPDMNARLEGDEVIYYDDVNPGMAIDTPAGLMVVILREVQKKTLFEIEDDFKALINKTREGKLTMDDTVGGTITISNLGKSRLTAFNSIVNNNECAIIGFGGISKEAVVMPDNSIVPRDVAHMTVNSNHVIVDGVKGSQFLEKIMDLLEHPQQLLEG